MLWNKPLRSFSVPPYHRAFDAVLNVGNDDDLPIKPQRVLHDLRQALAPRRHPRLRRGRPQAVGGPLLGGPRAQHRAHLQRLRGDGLRPAGRHRRQPRQPRPPQGGGHRRRRRLHDEHGGAGDGAPPGAAARRARSGPTAPTASSRCTRGDVRARHRARASRTRTSSPWPSRSASRACAWAAAGELPRRAAEGAGAPTGPVVVDIPVDYAENEKLGIDLWKLAPGAELRPGRAAPRRRAARPGRPSLAHQARPYLPAPLLDGVPVAQVARGRCDDEHHEQLLEEVHLREVYGAAEEGDADEADPAVGADEALKVVLRAGVRSLKVRWSARRGALTSQGSRNSGTPPRARPASA